jgi:Zn finger protein HypA/HybF involved in hydrogenase expression
VDRRYREDAIEMAVEMVAAGTIAENARYAQIEDQVTQDWETRHKLS